MSPRLPWCARRRQGESEETGIHFVAECSRRMIELTRGWQDPQLDYILEYPGNKYKAARANRPPSKRNFILPLKIAIFHRQSLDTRHYLGCFEAANSLTSRLFFQFSCVFKVNTAGHSVRASSLFPLVRSWIFKLFRSLFQHFRASFRPSAHSQSLTTRLKVASFCKDVNGFVKIRLAGIGSQGKLAAFETLRPFVFI